MFLMNIAGAAREGASCVAAKEEVCRRNRGKRSKMAVGNVLFG